MIIYLTDPRAVVTKRGGRLLISIEGEDVASYKLKDVRALLLLGPVEITTPAIYQLAREGIEVAFLTSRGRLLCQLTPPTPKNVALRLLQFRLHLDEKFTLRLAREIVAYKLEAMIAQVHKAAHNRLSNRLFEIHSGLTGFRQRLSKAGTLAEVGGVEGSSARLYFSGFGEMVTNPNFTFSGRTRRPPRDPLNALLSLFYSLLTTELNGYLDGVGFDPAVGYLHRPEFGRPSLALDLMEPFRPALVDRFVLRVVNLRQVRPDDFVRADDGGVIMSRPALRRVLALWEEYQHRPLGSSGETWQRRLEEAPRRLARYLESRGEEVLYPWLKR